MTLLRPPPPGCRKCIVATNIAEVWGVWRWSWYGCTFYLDVFFLKKQSFEWVGPLKIWVDTPFCFNNLARHPKSGFLFGQISLKLMVFRVVSPGILDDWWHFLRGWSWDVQGLGLWKNSGENWVKTEVALENRERCNSVITVRFFFFSFLCFFKICCSVVLFLNVCPGFDGIWSVLLETKCRCQGQDVQLQDRPCVWSQMSFRWFFYRRHLNHLEVG